MLNALRTSASAPSPVHRKAPQALESCVLPRLIDPSLDRCVVEDRAVLDVPDHALRVDEERLRQLEHRVLASDRAVEIEQGREAVERQRLHEATHAGTVLEEVDR